MGRPLILAQALTCSTFLWGLSQLCQTHPGSGARAAPGPQWEVWGGGGVGAFSRPWVTASGKEKQDQSQGKRQFPGAVSSLTLFGGG